MSEESKNSNSSQAASGMGVPVAIVIAGGLIAAALYFGGGGGGVVPANDLAIDDGQVPEETVGDMRPVDETDHIRGAKNAKITIVEYSDLECPFCKRFHPTVQQVLDAHPDDVRWVYRHFPLEQLHSKAPAEANAVECAGEQGKFWEMLDLIFEVTPTNDGLDLENLPILAQQVGVANAAQFQECVDTEKYADKVEADSADAEAAGGRGTPYSVILGPNGEKIPVSGAQPFEALNAHVESLL